MPAKILVVDDEPDLEQIVRQKFRRQIREGIFQFTFAQNGIEALQRLAEDPSIELVLTDINMPEMDGLTLLNKIREMENPLFRAVIVSAYGDIDNIRTAMNRGAFDFI
ncbi:response regulator, partial [candidate division KSB1 bacterium]|nr:response regulator [candidate division KSB1 bacterium]